MTSRRIIDILVVIGPSGCGKSTLIRRLLREFPRDVAFSVSHTTRPPRAGEIDGVDYHFVEKAHFEELLERRAMIEYTWLGGGETDKNKGETENEREEGKTRASRNYYGTSVRALEEILAQNKIVLMDTDILGAMRIRRYCEQKAMSLGSASPSLWNREATRNTSFSDIQEVKMNPMCGEYRQSTEEGALRSPNCTVIFIEPPDMSTLKARLCARKSESEDSLAFRLRLGSGWIRWADANKELIDYRLINDDLEQCYAKIKSILFEGCPKSLSSSL
ncbi:unnamed protein product [Phytomonas sp. EM1]|nr:unnamed protein product [Phytomonas sp. EM1]|eukprot:CCW60091.1 unnamed protein product [Phytomonas sp. isolate EM1]